MYIYETTWCGGNVISVAKNIADAIRLVQDEFDFPDSTMEDSVTLLVGDARSPYNGKRKVLCSNFFGEQQE